MLVLYKIAIYVILYDYISIVIDSQSYKKDDNEIKDSNYIREELMNTLSLDINNFMSDISNTDVFIEKVQIEAKKILEFKNDLAQEGIFDQFLRFVIFRTIDQNWKEHLHSMDQLREGINLRAYGQKNPLVEYKQEGYKMFEEMMLDTNMNTLKRIFRSNINQEKNSSSERTKNINLSHDKMPINFANPKGSQNQTSSSSEGIRKKSEPLKVGKKFGRNDKVKISNGSESKILKYKKAKELIEQGWNIID